VDSGVCKKLSVSSFLGFWVQILTLNGLATMMITRSFKEITS
jgi:hypothetical protein